MHIENLKVSPDKMGKSIRVAYCDHSFHRKTESTYFLVDILRARADVEVDLFWDEVWKGGRSVNLSEIAHYDIIIIFQAIHAGLPECIAAHHNNVDSFPCLISLG